MIVDPKIAHLREYQQRIEQIWSELKQDADLMKTVYVLDAAIALDAAMSELQKAIRKIKTSCPKCTGTGRLADDTRCDCPTGNWP